MTDQQFQIIAMFKRGFQPYAVGLALGIPAKQVYDQTLTIRRKWHLLNRKHIIRFFGGYL